MVHWSALVLSSALLQGVRALPQAAPSSVTAPPSITVSTVVASPSAPLSSALPSQVPLPPTQAWCPSEIFCSGELLQAVNIAKLYVDPKTFVDKPTSKSSQQVLAAFNKIGNQSATEGDLTDFVNTNFRGEGLELEAIALDNFKSSPSFLNNVSDPLVKAFSQTVHGYWTQLIRNTNDSALCPSGTQNGDCESSLIPLNHTFVVPGGRFREQYYWDSYWIVQGLIKSELFDIVKATLENFMDELKDFGFIPNGGRIYYLNRSQPPLFIHMLADYVAASNDTSILERALPLAEAELKWWAENRTLNVTSPFSKTTYAMARYAVNNTAPRPESYLTDYLTANDPALSTPLTAQQRADLYAELASGAETGWDYTARWLKEPLAGSPTDQNPKLRSLNVRGTIPVCLNSILYKAHLLLADLYSSQKTDESAVSSHRNAAEHIRAGVIDLFWDSSKLAFYDFNLTANARSSIYTVATFYPLWNGIIPDEVLASSKNAFGMFSVLNMVLNRYNGTFPATFLETGLQWDAPNTWPPHQHIALEALRTLPSNITSDPLPTPEGNASSFSLIPEGQLFVSEDALPVQSLVGGSNASTSGPAADINRLDGTVFNGGQKVDGEGWAATLQRELANRYVASALCSWHATGGQIPNLLPRLPDEQLNVTQSVNNTGNMFEKFSINDIDSAGRGGEYTVQAGFGWTNGVLLWVADNYGKVLAAPQCPDLAAQAAPSPSPSSSSSSSASSPTSSSGTGANGGSNGASSVHAGGLFAVVLAFVAGALMI
ncbi:glycoside hydrolase family 37 protein [Daedaleopsis nitida]|nr:glycoside hydrolase family 37 protein [Daedaleopsis nitida]